MATIAELFDRAVQHYQGGNSAHAEAACRQILEANPHQAAAHHLLGLLAERAGRHEEAINLIGQAIGLEPSNESYHFNLGNILLARGRLDQAGACYLQALQLKPAFLEALVNLASILREQGQRTEAMHCYRQALASHPRHVGILNNLALMLKEDGRLVEAIAYYRQALEVQPEYADALDNLGMALRAQGSLIEAAECCRQALRIDPAHPKAHNSLGTILQDLGRIDEALACYREALRLNPRSAEACFNLGTALMTGWRFAEAATCFRQALSLRPDYDKAHVNLGNALKEEGRLAEAAECFQQALRLRPREPEVIGNLGNVLVGQGCLAEGEACFREALGLDPANKLTRWNYCLLRLLRGDFTAAWDDFELRWGLPNWPPHGFAGPRWDGSSLLGKTILVFFEQGLGDTINFVRYLPMVKEQGCRVLFVCQRALQDLLAGIRGVDQFVLEGMPPPAYDVQVPLLSLPRLFKTTLATIPGGVPFMKAPPELITFWRESLGLPEAKMPRPSCQVNIGIAWQGNPKTGWDRSRSIPLENFEALARLPGVKLFSLQKGSGISQLPAFTAQFPVVDVGARLKTFSDTAAVMANLDMVISSDTSVAHLAGALGVSVWTVLQLVPDWRWQLERPDSPWYPTMRLFRQRRLGDWREVFDRMATELQ